MNILIAPDKFKGTLTASQVCNAIEAGLNKSGKEFRIRKFPLADGGDGTLDIFLYHQQGVLIEVEVHDPLMRKIKAVYALSKDGKTAFIEMAKSSGLMLLKLEEHNPLKSSSYGTGELISHALSKGAEQIIIGIGGSATNDAALGAAEALGFQFFDSAGNRVSPDGESLAKIVRIDRSNVHPRLEQVLLTAICDVTNPFYGEHGAAFVYAPQKGASPADVIRLDYGLRQIAVFFNEQFGIDVQAIPGAGAGGGFAGGAYALFGAELKRGIDVVFELTSFNEAIAWADVVITGEGKFDQQSLQGKVVDGVVRRAKKSGKKVYVVCGQNEIGEAAWKSLGVERVDSLTEFIGKEKALLESKSGLEELAFSVMSQYL
ncbi:MAG: glycerate kinase [Cyclobacteriaceae bacterium]|nr:glycerate kinase [Cyclobacteriaceae bacterium]UYN85468.1 MAG: glycerate kinase [Cyclobacteriaceae bacterium]